MAQPSSAIHNISYFPAAADVLPSLSSSTSMTSSTMIFESKIPQNYLSIVFHHTYTHTYEIYMCVCWCCPAPQKSIIRQRILHTLKMKRGSPSKYPLSENKHQICVKLCCRVMMHFFWIQPRLNFSCIKRDFTLFSIHINIQ